MLVVDVVLLLQTLLLPSCVPGSVGVEGVVLELLGDRVMRDSALKAAQLLVISTASCGAHARLGSVLSSPRDEELGTVSSERDRVTDSIKDRI
jgi:hypothetical protein